MAQPWAATTPFVQSFRDIYSLLSLVDRFPCRRLILNSAVDQHCRPMLLALLFLASYYISNVSAQQSTRPTLFRSSRSLSQSLSPALLGMQGSCSAKSSIVLQDTDCQNCMTNIFNRGDEFMGNIYACSSVCQDATLYSSLSSTAASSSDCSTCVQQVAPGG